MTGFYTMALCAGAAGGRRPDPAGRTPASAARLAAALAVWAVPALVVALIWLPQALCQQEGQAREHGVSRRGPLARSDWPGRSRCSWACNRRLPIASSAGSCPSCGSAALTAITAGGDRLGFGHGAGCRPALSCRISPCAARTSGSSTSLSALLAVTALLRSAVRAAFDRLDLGRPAGHRPGRTDRGRDDRDRAALAGCPCRRASLRHGAMRRLSACRDRAADRRPDPRLDRQLRPVRHSLRGYSVSARHFNGWGAGRAKYVHRERVGGADDVRARSATRDGSGKRRMLSANNNAAAQQKNGRSPRFGLALRQDAP